MIFESLNGEIVPGGSLLFHSGNRAFRYGDGIFDTIRLHRGKPLFWTDHEARITNSLKTLGLTADPALIRNDLELLAQKNNILSGRARLTIYRDGGGYYKPVSSQASCHILIEPLKSIFGALDVQGMKIGFYEDDFKTIGRLSGLKSCSALIYVAAGLKSSELNSDEMIISNTTGNVAEFTTGNLFLWKSGSAYTPALDEGCVDGIMRKQILRMLVEMNVPVFEKQISRNEVLEADEVWCTNVIRGIDWARESGEKKYTGEMASRLNKLLNQAWLE